MSLEPVMTVLPSALNATAKTGPAWPLSAIGVPEPSAFQTRAMASTEPVSTFWPSGLNATARTTSSWRNTTGIPEPSAFQTDALLR